MWHNTIVPFLVENPSMAIFLTLCLGYLVGKLKYKMLTLGTVTSVLLVGVVLGILAPEVKILPPLKMVFFLLFLFAIGYSVGPQFFRSFRKTGLPQVIFAAVVCVVCLGVTWLCAKLAGYNAGEAVGLFSGAQTISAVIGVGQETINGLHISEAAKESMNNVVPVMYAVTYVFGTAGSAWIIAFVGPRLMGGFQKCRQDCVEEEAQMGQTLVDQPGYGSSLREVAFRCYRVDNDWFGTGKKVSDLEAYLKSQGRRLFVDRIRHNGQITDTPKGSAMIFKGDEVVLSGRREAIIGEETWIGEEAQDQELLNFPIRIQPVMVASKAVDGKTVKEIREMPFMHGVSIRSIKRQQSIDIPVRENNVVDGGDMMTLVGLPYDVDTAAKAIGRASRQTTATDIIFVSLGILIGGIIGVLSFNAGSVPISLTTSGGALIMGLIFGWWHSKRPDYGQVPEPAVWIFRDLGLNMFIACVGLECGPHFVQAFAQVGWMLLVWGAIATALPLIISILLARYVFKFRPGTALGCVAGSRTTTAALGAVEESLHSNVPAMGYAVTYAVGNTLLILFGVVMVILFA
ncbi:aspartate-alanine antiporter [Paramuribaculum intestinale]|jgi:putative transport protein|uniref:aspartate-alanine antiporter n=2 Tax=Paramuribaculum intestinale TaxID=2094151 RepID=UPI00259CB64E|nr:aspartate-alanine antiporter [Paramuribaculum intestinale]